SFVLADIPGLVAGAAQGAGLGTRFLKHLERTRLLLHVVAARLEDEEGTVAEFRSVEEELGRYSERLASQPRWLVLNKIDLLAPEDRAGYLERLVARLGWQGAAYGISALTGEGTEHLARDAMTHIERSEEP